MTDPPDAATPERFTAVRGRQVISRASAEHLGTVSHLLVDAQRRAISHLVIGRGRNARMIAWDHVTGFGADAVIVDADDALREAFGHTEEAAVGGDLELVGKRVLSWVGDQLGKVEEVSFDPASGILTELTVAGRERPASDLLGAGSYAVVLRDDE